MYNHRFSALVVSRFIGKGITTVLGFVTTTLMARYLGASSFGDYSFIMTAVLFIYLIADFGIETLLIRDTAVAPVGGTSDAMRQDISLRIAMTAITTCVVSIIVWFLPLESTTKTGLFIASWAMSVQMLVSLIWAIFQGRMAFYKLVLCQIVLAGAQCIGVLYGLMVEASLVYFFANHGIALVVTLMVSMYCVGRAEAVLAYTTRISELRTAVSRALPFAIGLLISVAYFRVDTLILAYYHQSVDVGLYALAYKPFEVATVIGGLVSGTVYPYIARVKRDALRKLVRHYAYIAVVCAGGISALLYVTAPIIIDVMGGDGYGMAVAPLRILAGASGVTILAGFCVAVALAGGKERMLTSVAACALGINIVANLVYIPHFSYIAASWITLMTQTAILVGNGYAAWYAIRLERS